MLIEHVFTLARNHCFKVTLVFGLWRKNTGNYSSEKKHQPLCEISQKDHCTMYKLNCKVQLLINSKYFSHGHLSFFIHDFPTWSVIVKDYMGSHRHGCSSTTAWLLLIDVRPVWFFDKSVQVCILLSTGMCGVCCGVIKLLYMCCLQVQWQQTEGVCS